MRPNQNKTQGFYECPRRSSQENFLRMVTFDFEIITKVLTISFEYRKLAAYRGEHLRPRNASWGMAAFVWKA